MLNIDFITKEENLHYPRVWDIEPVELQDILKRNGLDGIELVDVRLKEEFQSEEIGHIRGSKLVPLDVLVDHVEEFSKEKPIVFICRSGWRSAKAAAYFAEHGFKHVYNLKGGLLYWNELKLEIEL